MLRAYSKYMKQLALPYTRPYIADTLAKNVQITQQICELFSLRFDPAHNANQEQSETECKIIEEQINVALESVENLTEDQILRQYLCLSNATLRTNFYQI